MLVPVGVSGRNLPHLEITEGMRALRKRVKIDKMSVREMIRAGH